MVRRSGILGGNPHRNVFRAAWNRARACGDSSRASHRRCDVLSGLARKRTHRRRGDGCDQTHVRIARVGAVFGGERPSAGRVDGHHDPVGRRGGDADRPGAGHCGMVRRDRSAYRGVDRVRRALDGAAAIDRGGAAVRAHVTSCSGASTDSRFPSPPTEP